jgi:hypothetical protein
VIAAIVLHLANIFHMQSPFDPLHSDGYQFWSGIGSDLGEAGILLAILAWWKHHNCQIDRCWRVHLRTPTAGGHCVCKKHHPAHAGNHLTAEHVNAAHNAATAAAATAAGATPVPPAAPAPPATPAPPGQPEAPTGPAPTE